MFKLLFFRDYGLDFAHQVLDRIFERVAIWNLVDFIPCVSFFIVRSLQKMLIVLMHLDIQTNISP